MAWDTEGTRRRLLDAASRQFAAHGFSGARIAKIGQDAGVNKERIYRYFGDKQGVFDAVLARELGGFLSGVEITGTGAGALGDFAGRMFDRCCGNPALPRLLAWESLEVGEAAALERRRPMCRRNAEGIRHALSLDGREITRQESEHLLLSIISLTVGWVTLARVAESVFIDGVADSERRAVVVAQAEALGRGVTGDRH